MHNQKAISENWIKAGNRSVSTSTQIEAFCLQIVDFGLVGVIFVAPLFFGGRHDLGRFVLVLLCAVTASAWSIRQAVSGKGKWNGNAALTMLGLAIGMVVFQLVPLSSEWLATLAPRNTALLPLWGDNSPLGDSLPGWSTLSLAPEATRMGLATLMAYGLLFITVTQRLQDFEDIKRLLRWIALSAVMMASFGLVQYFTANGLFFWVYEFPFSNTFGKATGSFSCRNHFAHFLVLGMGPLVAWAMYRAKVRQQANARPQKRTSFDGRFTRSVSPTTLALIIGAITGVLAVMLSFSRGGALALASSAVVLAVVYLRRRLISVTGLVCTVAGLAVIVLAMLSVYGYDQVARRLDDFTSGSLEELDNQGGRRKIWAANVEAFRAGWQTGAGVGSHRHIYPPYLPESLSKEYTHAENGYLQILTENGVPGAVLLLWAISCCGFWCARALRYAQRSTEIICAGAVTASLAASVVHSIVDFVWFIPACMAVTILLACCALRMGQLFTPVERSSPCEAHLSRPAWIGFAAISCLAGLWAVSTLLGPATASLHWDRYLLASIASEATTNRLLTRPEQITTEQQQAAQMATDSMIAELRQVLQKYPNHARAHLRLAGSYLRRFEWRQAHSQNQMSIAQIRDASIVSSFSSSSELREWLVRAFSQDCDLLYLAYQHSQQALRNCPLQGEAYLYLANLCFLEGKGPREVEAYLAQALRVDPHGSDVLFAAGLHEFLLGRLEKALVLWRDAFAGSGNHQYEIINLFAGKIPASVFLEEFQPDWQTLGHVWTRYRMTGDRQQLETIVEYAQAIAAKESADSPALSSGRLWLRLAWMQTELEQHKAALESLREALKANPNDFQVRYNLGTALMQCGYSQEAEQQFNWCITRQPNHPGAQKKFLEATKVRVGRVTGPDSFSSSSLLTK